MVTGPGGTVGHSNLQQQFYVWLSYVPHRFP